MEIIRAQILGFCSGVRRAVNSADEALKNNSDSKGNVYTFGPLIHNPIVLEKFEKRGLKILSDDKISDLGKNDTVLIRAHGVPPEMEQKLRATGSSVVNATCPLVTMSQKRAAKFAENNYNIIFAGDKNHGEVAGIEGYAIEAAKKNNLKVNFLLVRTEDDVLRLFDNNEIDFNKKTVLLSQTTFSIAVFENIKNILTERIPEIEVFNSICPATHERQEALEKLCQQVEGVVVIGGRNSANTNRLLKTALNKCGKAILIESAAENLDEFKKLSKVGITAGASTPDDVIEEVESALLKNKSF